MVITWHGENCFKIQSGKISIVSNPLPRFKGDIVLVTDLEKSSKGPLFREYPSAPNQFSGPGEYEVQEIEIEGLPGENPNQTVYLMKAEDIKVGFLSNDLQKLELQSLEKFGDVDILFLPTTFDIKLIKQIQPKIIIPFYKKPDDLKSFLKKLEQKVEQQEKLTIKKKDITEKMRIVVLKV